MMDVSAFLGVASFGILLVLLALGVVAIVRPIARRLPRAPIVEYVPPEGDLLSHGLLVRADRRLLTAVVTDLAVRGSVRILTPRGSRGPVAIEVVHGARFSAEEWQLLAALRPHRMRARQQRRYVRALAEIGVVVGQVDDAPDVVFVRGPGSFRRHRRHALKNFLDGLRHRVVAEGLARKRPVSIHLVMLSLLFLVTVAFGLLLILGALVDGEWIGAIVVLLTMAALFWVLTLSPPPLLWFTDAGRERRRHLAGLRDYMKLAEQDRIRFLQSPEGALRSPTGELTPTGRIMGLAPAAHAANPAAQSGLDRIILDEKLLPYAILFRQERRWHRELHRLGGAHVSRNVEVLGGTLEGVIAVLDVLVIIGQVLRVTGTVVSFLGRST
ncbi:hypothetical protein [Leucobacter sp. NPDC077196]|uniref:hypothetical protein n=1 Tax=Leucobacter sp. NPDC077196 TaxID=3154959 RepID=UPI0034278C10